MTPRRCWRRRASTCARCARRWRRPTSAGWRTSPAAGLVDNPPRILADGLVMRLDERKWPQLAGVPADRGRGRRRARRCAAPSTAGSAWSPWSRRATPSGARGLRGRRRARFRRRRDRRPAAARRAWTSPASARSSGERRRPRLGPGTNLQAILDAGRARRARPARASSSWSRTWPACARSSGRAAAGVATDVLRPPAVRRRGQRSTRRWWRRCAGTASSWWCWPASCAC